ncbi:MAG TPA: AMIN domain-containing protein [Gemmatimonadaceae bacterium]|jgi:type IV pilus assembly protein PilQ|nr:AMIN domain-containing protein [Gemmatimonadaceae bacterium]
MRRVWTLAGVTVLALLGANVTVARASRPTPRAAGEVISLSVVPALGRAEVVINVDGPVDVLDFTLGNPARIVLDVTGATLGMPPRLYDKMRRGAITNIRVAQYKEDVVRVVIDLDSEHPYKVSREDGAVRVSIDAEATRFSAWHATPELATPVDPTPVRNVASQVGKHRVTANKGRLGPAAPVAAPQPRITVTYQDADIRDVIAAFAVFSGRTIVVGKGVLGTVSAEVRDQPWDVALRAILQSQGLAAREDQDGIITVDSYEAIAAQQALEPLTTQIIEVNYARASSLRETLKGLLSKDCGNRPGTNGAPAAAPAAGTVCTTRGDVAVDSSTNRLIVTDVPSRLQDITNYVRDLDVRTPQVAIKAKIIFVNRTNIEDIGLSYDFGSKNQFFNRLVQRPDPSTFTPIDTDGDGINDALSGTPFPQSTNVIDLGGNAVSAIANANQRVVQPALELVYSAALGKFSLTAFLDALQEVRLADIQAEPSIVTLDNRKAEILVGEETPIRVIDLGAQAQAGAGGQQQQPRATVSFKETGIILQVTPHITNNRQILMTLHSERSNLQAAASDLGFTFQKQRADNQLLVADGETAVIGGLTVTQVTVSKVGIPVLVELPLIGRLFGSTRTQEEKRDLLILVTPHIIDEGERLGVPGGSR